MNDSSNDAFAQPAPGTRRLLGPRMVWLIVVNLVLLLAVAGGITVLVKNSRKTKPQAQPPQALNQNMQATGSAQPELPVINPNSNTANRYFSGDSNAIDFRKDGSKGDFTIGMEKKDGKVVLNWDKSLKVTGVTVYDMGRLDILTDHKVIFSLSYVDPKSLPRPSFDPQALQKQLQQATASGKKPVLPSLAPLPTIAPPTVFIPTPYMVGQVPQGYFNTTPTENNQQPQTDPNALFKPGKRYSIEVYAMGADGKPKMASFTFSN